MRAGTQVPSAARYIFTERETGRATMFARLQAEQLQQQQKREPSVLFALVRAAVLTAPVAALLLTAHQQ